jgi:hypothetical protein
MKQGKLSNDVFNYEPMPGYTNIVSSKAIAKKGEKVFILSEIDDGYLCMNGISPVVFFVEKIGITDIE